MVENLKDTVDKILENNELTEELKNSKTLEEVHKKCQESGYKGNYEEFKRDYNQIVASLCENISEKELELVCGGKMNNKLTKATAAMLSALTLSTTVAPYTSAATLECQTSQNKFLRYFKENSRKVAAILGGGSALTVGTIVTGIIAYACYKNKKANTNENQNQPEQNPKTPKTTPKTENTPKDFSNGKGNSNPNKNQNQPKKNLETPKTTPHVEKVPENLINTVGKGKSNPNPELKQDNYISCDTGIGLWYDETEDPNLFISKLNEIKNDIFIGARNGDVKDVFFNVNKDNTCSLGANVKKSAMNREILNENWLEHEPGNIKWNCFDYSVYVENENKKMRTLIDYGNNVFVTFRDKNGSRVVDGIGTLRGLIKGVESRESMGIDYSSSDYMGYTVKLGRYRVVNYSFSKYIKDLKKQL